MITGIALISALVFLAAKALVDSSDWRLAQAFSKILTWLIIPPVTLFIASLIVRVAELVPEVPLIF